MSIFLRIVAALFFLQAFSLAFLLAAAIIGFADVPWANQPWSVRAVPLAFLPVSLLLGFGLWRTRLWAVGAWVTITFLGTITFLSLPATDVRRSETWYSVLPVVVVLGIFLLLLSRGTKGVGGLSEGDPAGFGQTHEKTPKGGRERAGRGRLGELPSVLSLRHIALRGAPPSRDEFTRWIAALHSLSDEELGEIAGNEEAQIRFLHRSR